MYEKTRSAVKAYNAGAQTCTKNSYVKVTYDTEVYDVNSEYDHSTNYRFTAKETGIYNVNALITTASVSWAAGNAIWLVAYVDGSQYCYRAATTREATQTTKVTVGGSDDIFLSAGQYLEIYAYIANANDVALTVNSQVSGYLSIIKVA